MRLFEATGPRDVPDEPDPDERIEVVPWPLTDLDGAIDQCGDAKSVIALQFLGSRSAVARFTGRCTSDRQALVAWQSRS